MSSPPRFLNFGDECELAVVIQNQLDEKLDVKIGIRSSEHAEIKISDGEYSRETGYSGWIPAEGRRLLNVPIKVTNPGRARFQITCSSGKFGDAADVVFPIYPPTTTESFALYGSLGGVDDVVFQPIVKPANALPQFGALEVRKFQYL